MTEKFPTVSRYTVPREKTTSSMWPANMFAKSRTARVNGRMMKTWSSSIGVTRISAPIGTPGGMAASLKYFPAPCSRMPTQL